MASIGSFTGVASGFDSRSYIEAILTADRRPAVVIESQIKSLQGQRDAWGTYRGLLTELNGTLDALRDGSALSAAKATVSGTGAGGKPLLSATAGTGAEPGSYRVEVVSVARAGSSFSQRAVTDTAAALGLSGGFTVNGTAVSVAATDSLAQVRDKINAAGAGVSASLVSTNGTNYSLVLRGEANGASSLVLVDGPEGVLGATGLNVSTTAGADAQVRVNGLLLTRSANAVTDAIAGVTLNLLAAEPGTEVEVALERDTTAGRDAVRKLVDAYNKVVDFFTQQAAVGTAGRTPALSGDPLLRSARGGFREALVTPLASNPSGAQLLSQLGLEVERSGRIAFDTAAFDAARDAEPEAVSALLADRATALQASIESATRFGGLLDAKTRSLRDRIDAAQGRVDRIDDRLGRKRESLTRQFARLEEAMSRLQNQSSSVSSQLAALL